LSLDEIEGPKIDIRSWISLEKLEELTESIRVRGVLQPLRVRKDGERYEIQDGHRRYMAAQKAGLATVPCLVVETEEELSEVDKLHANLAREDLSPLEVSRHLHILKDRYGYDNEGLSSLMGVGVGRVRQLLGLTKLDPILVKALDDKRIGERVATALQQVPEEPRRHYLLNYALDGGATIKTIEAWVRSEKTRGVEPPVWQGELGEQPPPEEVPPLTLKCASCHQMFPANSMLNMTLDPECYAIAERLFREIRKNLQAEETTEKVEEEIHGM
jgi:ParB family chromosome partitioning protein